MRIGVIGAGNTGGTPVRHFAKLGRQVSSRERRNHGHAKKGDDYE